MVLAWVIGYNHFILDHGISMSHEFHYCLIIVTIAPQVRRVDKESVHLYGRESWRRRVDIWSITKWVFSLLFPREPRGVEVDKESGNGWTFSISLYIKSLILIIFKTHCVWLVWEVGRECVCGRGRAHAWSPSTSHPTSSVVASKWTRVWWVWSGE
jgi:hypothetical protein